METQQIGSGGGGNGNNEEEYNSSDDEGPYIINGEIIPQPRTKAERRLWRKRTQ